MVHRILGTNKCRNETPVLYIFQIVGVFICIAGVFCTMQPWHESFDPSLVDILLGYSTACLSGALMSGNIFIVRYYPYLHGNHNQNLTLFWMALTGTLLSLGISLSFEDIHITYSVTDWLLISGHCVSFFFVMTMYIIICMCTCAWCNCGSNKMYSDSVSPGCSVFCAGWCARRESQHIGGVRCRICGNRVCHTSHCSSHQFKINKTLKLNKKYVLAMPWLISREGIWQCPTWWP